MTPEQKAMVKETWAQVEPIAEQAAELFYGRLFQTDPALKALFKGDMKEQGKKLMASLALVVKSLDDLESVVPAVQALGRRHVDYGVKEADYDTVGAALLWTLGQGLGEAFTDDVKGAWTEAYTLVATVMKQAAAEVAA